MTGRPLSDILEDAFIRCRDLQAPLAVGLQVFADELRRIGSHLAEAVDAQVKRLVESGAGATAPKLGELTRPRRHRIRRPYSRGDRGWISCSRVAANG